MNARQWITTAGLTGVLLLPMNAAGSTTLVAAPEREADEIAVVDDATVEAVCEVEVCVEFEIIGVDVRACVRWDCA